MYSSSLPESYIFYPAFFSILSLALTPGPQGVQGQKGEKGEKGDPGEDGAVAITELSPGMFALSVNAEGHLILTHNDNEPAPPLSIQDGKLIYTIS